MARIMVEAEKQICPRITRMIFLFWNVFASICVIRGATLSLRFDPDFPLEIGHTFGNTHPHECGKGGNLN